jgi:ribosome biogenesis GTPase A
MRVRYSFSSRHTKTIDPFNNHREEFPKVVREMIAETDIVIEVLDSRFIQETRNQELESLAKNSNKKIIYVINKSDLSDKSKIKEQIEKLNLFPHALVSCKNREGSSELRKRIKIEASRIKKDKVLLGVLGYPNTGKSSIINILTGKSSAKTAPEAGFTKGIQKVKLSDGIYLIDAPGIIPKSKYSHLDIKKVSEHAEHGARGHEKVNDPDLAVQKIMHDYPGLLEKFYDVDAKGDSEQLIEQVGRKKHFLKKGNEVDIDRVSRLILKDWQIGNIRI